ncbi:GNAT family N-acetyltransferase [Variovorax sp. LjRoot290]|uniref:GNAT family N-acetyltransferase n=1 Tax=Variovorax sp. LjRoot290 TaxID=3342316 RepID=UPI003F510A7D
MYADGSVRQAERLSAESPVEKPLAFHEVSAERWPDFERLFEAKGSPKYCWCMAWRASSAEAKEADDASRKAAMKERVCSGTPVGLLAYAGEEPVAWCSIAPRSTYRRLVGDQSADDGIWSIACFFVVRRLRGTGISRQLIAAAVRHARSHGAKMIEAYPVDADSPSYRFMGFVPVFAEAGFAEVGREGKRRHVMRLKLSSPRRSNK